MRKRAEGPRLLCSCLRSVPQARVLTASAHLRCLQHPGGVSQGRTVPIWVQGRIVLLPGAASRRLCLGWGPGPLEKASPLGLSFLRDPKLAPFVLSP